MQLAENLSPVESVYRGGTSCVSVYGNVLFSITWGQEDPKAFEASWRATDQLVNRYPEGFAKIVVVTTGLSNPPADVRKRHQELAQRFEDHTMALAFVLEGDGLWTSSMRMLIRAAMVAFGPKFPQHIDRDCAHAVDWLNSTLGAAGEFDPDVLLSALRAARPVP